jgi:hypothetical protein
VFLQKARVFDYVEYGKKRGLQKVYLNTNLVFFEPAMIDRLDASGLDKLTIGLDAATHETYRSIRVDKKPANDATNFGKVEANVHALLDAKASGRLKNLEIVLQFIVQDENRHEEAAFKAKWAGSGATLKVRHKLGWGDAIPTEGLVLPPEDRTVPCPWLMRTMSIHWTGTSRSATRSGMGKNTSATSTSSRSRRFGSVSSRASARVT